MTTPTPARRALADPDLLAAAARFFAAHGYADADIGVLAQELGVGKGSIYRRYPSKERLFLAALDHGMAEAMAAAAAARAGVADGDGIAQLRAGVRAYLAFFDARPELVELMVQERAFLRRRGESTYFAQRRQHQDERNERWRRLVAAGRIRDLAPDDIADVITDLIYGALVTRLFSGATRPLAERADLLLRVLLHGLLADGGPDRAGAQP